MQSVKQTCTCDVLARTRQAFIVSYCTQCCKTRRTADIAVTEYCFLCFVCTTSKKFFKQICSALHVSVPMNAFDKVWFRINVLCMLVSAEVVNE
jgi:hypothetical protein